MQTLERKKFSIDNNFQVIVLQNYAFSRKCRPEQNYFIVRMIRYVAYTCMYYLLGINLMLAHNNSSVYDKQQHIDACTTNFQSERSMNYLFCLTC